MKQERYELTDKIKYLVVLHSQAPNKDRKLWLSIFGDKLGSACT